MTPIRAPARPTVILLRALGVHKTFRSNEPNLDHYTEAATFRLERCVRSGGLTFTSRSRIVLLDLMAASTMLRSSLITSPNEIVLLSEGWTAHVQCRVLLEWQPVAQMTTSLPRDDKQDDVTTGAMRLIATDDVGKD